MMDAVSILGLGARTAIGENVATSMAAARAGIAGFLEHPFMVSAGGDPYILAWAPFVGPEPQGVDRLLELSVPAALEALAPVAALKLSAPTIPVFVGIPAERPGMPSSAAAEFGRQLSARLTAVHPVRVQVIASGHSAGLMALEQAIGLLRSGKESFCLIGGVDSYVDPDTLDWIESSKRLHAEDNPYGFIPGEAAGFCLLAGADLTRRHRRAVLGEIPAAATAIEKNLIATDSVCIGLGLTEVFRNTLKGVPGKVDEVVCDANGEPYRADEYGFALARVGEKFARATDFVAPADCWGDVGAASGPLFVARACTAARRGYARGPLTLVWTGSDGGQRSAALVQALPQEGDVV